VWQARQNDRLSDRPRRRAPGTDAKYTLRFIDRLLVTTICVSRHRLGGIDPTATILTELSWRWLSEIRKG
jgi:hypothetical protein